MSNCGIDGSLRMIEKMLGNIDFMPHIAHGAILNVVEIHSFDFIY